MNETQPEPVPEHWPEVAPHLDAALGSLAPADRDAVVVRFLERQPFRVVADRFGISEDAAKKRVQRAVEKLRDALARRGVALSAAALTAVLLQGPSQAAPASLSQAVAAGAVNQAAPAWVAELAREAGWDLMLDKVKTWMPVAAAAVVIVGGFCLWSLTGESPASAPATARVGNEGPVVTQRPRVAKTAAIAAGQRGPSQVVINVRSAEGNQPLIASVSARGSAYRAGGFRQDLTTAADGVAEITVDGAHVDHLNVWVSAAGYVPVYLSWTGHEFVEPVLRHTVRLQKGQLLRGLVQNENGAPVSGAMISFNGPGLDLGERENIGFLKALTSVQSDDQGHFQSDQMPVPVGDHSVTYNVEHPDYVRGSGGISGVASLQTNHVVVLKRGYMVRGRVVDQENNPLAGAEVGESHHFAGPKRNVTVDASGAFELGPFAAGEMRVEATADGYKESNQRVTVSEQGAEVVFRLEPAALDERSEWQRGMDNGATVRLKGEVVDALSGAPVPQFRVRLDEHRGTAKILLGEGHDGQFDWRVFMAFFHEFSLEVEAPGYAPATTEARPVATGSESFAIQLQPGTSIVGVVVAPSGEPVANAFVGLNGEGFGCMLVEGCRPSSGSDAPQTTTDAQGRFSFKLRAGAESVLIANDLGCALVGLNELANRPVVLQPWGAIEGVLMVAGSPAANQGVWLGCAIGFEPEGALVVNTQGNTTTDAEGRFRFAKVPPGPVAIGRYFNFNRDKMGPIGMSHPQKVVVPAGEVTQVTLAGQGRMVTGRLALSRELKGHHWADDLQSLVEVGLAAPRLSGAPNTPEWRRGLRQLERAAATQRKFFLEIAPEGAFRIQDVPPGDYTLELAVAEPPNPDAYDPLGNPVFRRTLVRVSRPVRVEEGESTTAQDLGTIVIELP